MTRVDKIEDRIKSALEPVKLEITDDSKAHAGHAGAMESGGGHFSALVVASAFEGKNLVQRHRLVYQALGDLMQTDIHALNIRAFSPDEFND